MQKTLVYLSFLMLVGCTTARIKNLPAPVVSQARQFETLEQCEAKLAELHAKEQEKKTAGEDYADLSEALCEEKGASAGEVAKGFLLAVTAAAMAVLAFVAASF